MSIKLQNLFLNQTEQQICKRMLYPASWPGPIELPWKLSNIQMISWIRSLFKFRQFCISKLMTFKKFKVIANSTYTPRGPRLSSKFSTTKIYNTSSNKIDCNERDTQNGKDAVNIRIKIIWISAVGCFCCPFWPTSSKPWLKWNLNTSCQSISLIEHTHSERKSIISNPKKPQFHVLEQVYKWWAVSLGDIV